jgi:outer membrane lipoprotein-sorting protein
LIFAFLAPLAAEVEHEILQVPADVSSILREQAMPKFGDSNLEKILSRYYMQGLGGAEVWSQISSMRLKGTIRFDGAEFKMRCYQRKPNRLKMILEGTKGQHVVLGYDGKEAWQHMPTADSPGVLMPSADARRFIHSAVFGNYLLYPYRVGKTIEYLGTVRENDTVCYQIRVVLGNEFTVDYFIDIRTYLDLKIVNRDLKLNTTTELICDDFRMVEGFPVAHKVESVTGDNQKTVLNLSQVDFNIGLTDWMFDRPE